jgi:hypothetical protein
MHRSKSACRDDDYILVAGRKATSEDSARCDSISSVRSVPRRSRSRHPDLHNDRHRTAMNLQIVLDIIRAAHASEEQPSYDDLTFFCAAHRATIARALAELERRRVLRIFRARGLRNRYTVNGAGVRVGE